MGLFDWLFGKKNEGESASATATRGFNRQWPNTIQALLQQVKELPPNDPRKTANLLREMLQAAVTLPAGSEHASELNMALDSMARHYPDALAELAGNHSDAAVRGLAATLRSQRQELRGLANGTVANLQRWRQAAAMAWVTERQGQWNHAQWLHLLDQLRQSEYWPMDEEQIGRVLEETKQEWLRQYR